MKEIKFLPLDVVNAPYKSKFNNKLKELFSSGRFVGGSEVADFEASFAEYLSVRECVAVGNGYDALVVIFLSYIELGLLKPGDRVLVPAHTFIASINAVINAGLKPIFCEVSDDTLILDPHNIEKLCLEDASAILWVHLYGRVDGYEEINALSKKFNLLIIEDAAQAHGAIYGGRKAGNLGDAAAFSFYPGKNLGAIGDAGAICTSNDDLASTARKISNYGSDFKYSHSINGLNSRMDPIQAIFLSEKLKYLEDIITRRGKVAELYCEGIANSEIVTPDLVNAPDRHAWHVYAIRLDRRDELQNYLKSKQVQTIIHYPVLTIDQLFLSEKFNYPDFKRHGNFLLSLPIHECLGYQDVNKVVELVSEFKNCEGK